jgi:rubrerythrin
MSILAPFERLFDTAGQIARRERDREQDLAGDPEGEGDGPAPPPPGFRCRVCGLEAAEPAYCPVCLADTMKPLAATRR